MPTQEPRRFRAKLLAQPHALNPDSEGSPSMSLAVASTAAPPPAQRGPTTTRRFVRPQVPAAIADDPALLAAVAVLPPNYSFEIPKTVWRLRAAAARRVALQFPEGLLMFACAIADILEEFAGVDECLVLGDVTYGACCVDDLSAAALGADFLVHYGHSCLVPVDYTAIPCLYVFVDIAIDVPRLVAAVEHNFAPQQRLVLAGTIQFAAAVQAARAALAPRFPSLAVPQAKPLSPGEVLGCTAPVLPAGSADAIVFVADGRFHLESIMIANPAVPAFRYDPYARTITREQYDHRGMRAARRRAIEAARSAPSWGVVFGTLGRQGNPRVLEHVTARLAVRGLAHTVFLVSELTPGKVAALGASVQAWVQIACPRLSIDWGEAFAAPLLTPYELEVALGFAPPWWETGGAAAADAAASPAPVAEGTAPAVSCGDAARGGCACPGGSDGAACSACEGGGDEPLGGQYPMDYYARDGGPWNGSYLPKPAGGGGLARKGRRSATPGGEVLPGRPAPPDAAPTASTALLAH